MHQLLRLNLLPREHLPSQLGLIPRHALELLVPCAAHGTPLLGPLAPQHDQQYPHQQHSPTTAAAPPERERPQQQQRQHVQWGFAAPAATALHYTSPPPVALVNERTMGAAETSDQDGFLSPTLQASAQSHRRYHQIDMGMQQQHQQHQQLMHGVDGRMYAEGQGNLRQPYQQALHQQQGLGQWQYQSAHGYSTQMGTAQENVLLRPALHNKHAADYGFDDRVYGVLDGRGQVPRTAGELNAGGGRWADDKQPTAALNSHVYARSMQIMRGGHLPPVGEGRESSAHWRIPMSVGQPADDMAYGQQHHHHRGLHQHESQHRQAYILPRAAAATTGGGARATLYTRGALHSDLPDIDVSLPDDGDDGVEMQQQVIKGRGVAQIQAGVCMRVGM
jgi:hypothetical protein